MAVSNVSSPTKIDVYESLYLIGQLTHQITYHLDRLRSAKILAREFVEQEKEAARELRAVVAASATMNLTQGEVQEAFQHQKNRIRIQTKLAQIKSKTKPKIKLMPKLKQK